MDGTVLVNGQRQPKNFKCMSGYVVQVCYVCCAGSSGRQVEVNNLVTRLATVYVYQCSHSMHSLKTFKSLTCQITIVSAVGLA